MRLYVYKLWCVLFQFLFYFPLENAARSKQKTVDETATTLKAETSHNSAADFPPPDRLT